MKHTRQPLKAFTLSLATFTFAFGLALLTCSCKRDIPPFSIGADMSFIPQYESRGMAFSDTTGQEQDVLAIMAANGFDNIRLRIFVDPQAPGGYSAEGFCNLEQTVAMAQRIVAAGMTFSLDFHYSDYWADPDKQYKPSAWNGLTGEALENALYEYTHHVLTTLKEAGAAPQIIQPGNEINHGMVWPEGYIDDNAREENWAALMGLYKAAVKAAREVLPESRLMVHLALGGQNILCREFLDIMNRYGAEFDLIGLSYYEQWHETYDDLQANLYDLAARYDKPLYVCEYGANPDNIRRINDIVRSVPGGLGAGTMAWEPARVLFPMGKADPAILDIYRDMAATYKKRAPREMPLPRRELTFDRPIVGADISWVPEQEDKGTVFSDNGVEKDVMEILKDNGFNWVRLRLFVDPAAENGYSPQGFCGLEKTLEMARRAKNAGLKLLLNFHYSDTWADPGKQYTPSSWAQHAGSGLEGQVYRYTYEVIRRFMEEGVCPDMVQTGNEINHGMLWPQGKIEDSYMHFGVLLRCATAAVRAANPSIPVMVHIACGGQNDESVYFLDKILSRDVKFDIIGQSYYPQWHGTLEDLQHNLNDLAARYNKPVIVVEYQEHRLEVNRIVRDIPGEKGLGTFIWEATSPRWGNLFDEKGATNENMKLYPQFLESYDFL
ncbi:MAG TPA: glycosyl hydrolase 53 family protein [Bacteroidales bacterium]|nr:glycosyl hydrolase 53 family protein [Bacteroidales bacterium]